MERLTCAETNVSSLVGSLFGAGASLIGSSEQASANSAATKAQAAATQAALAQQQNQYNTTRQDALDSQARIAAATQPYSQVGTSALNTLAAQYGLAGSPGTAAAPTYTPVSYTAPTASTLPSSAAPDTSAAAFQQDPGYQYALQQATLAATGAGLARGFGGSGALYNSVAKNAEGLASQEYNNFYNRATETAQNTFNNGLASAQVGFNQNAANAQNTFNAGTTNAQNSYNAANNAYQSNFNMLTGLAGYGQTANALNANVATGTQSLIANAGMDAANNSSNLITAQGNATAGGLAANGALTSQTIGQLGGLGANVYNQLNPSYGNIGAQLVASPTNPSYVNTSPYGTITPAVSGIGGLSQVTSPSLYGGG